MALIFDSLRSVLERIGFKGSQRPIDAVFSHQLALAAYMQSGMLRKVIAIPAEDRVRAWREWQATEVQIEKIEAEERRLGLQAKIEAAEVLRGIGGGALLLVTAGNHASELKPETIAEGGLVAVNLLSRWQIQGVDWINDLADPLVGTPRMWRISSGTRGHQDIHPSRVVCFRGKPVPAGAAMNPEDAFWGDSQLLRVFREVERADQTQEWFAALVKKAKLTRIGMPNLDEMDDATLGKRMEVVALGENSLNAVFFRSPSGADDPGETITDYQITWAGIPAVMDAFDQRVAAVADIPFTRLQGRSPAGMNATGDHDTDNWNKMVESGQTLQLRPCLDQIDPILIRSAGIIDPDGKEGAEGKKVGAVTWKFAPLDTPTAKEETDRFKIWTEAMEKVGNSGTIPDIAYSKAYQNGLIENEWAPGLEAALDEVPEAERFPEGPTEEEIRAEVEAELAAKGGGPASAGGGGAAKPPARRAVNDGTEDGGAPTGDRPFDDARRGKRGRSGGFDQSKHPRGRGGKFRTTGSGPSVNATAKFAKSVKRGKDDTRVHNLGPTRNASNILTATRHDVSGFVRIIPAGAVQHALKGHGADSPRLKRGERPVRPRDVARVAHRLGDGSRVVAKGKVSDGSGIRLEHRVQIGKRTAIYIERIGRRDRQLRMVTMRWER
jgi:phage-related protein (TIGR01555 family)